MNYLNEWQASGVDEELTQLNVIALEGSSPSEYLLYSDDIPRRNDGRVSDGFLKRYAHTEDGGWWCSGIDLLTGEEDLWGCFKPDRPRCNEQKGKPIKYEHPPKVPTGIFALKIPRHIWQRIADRYGVEILPEDRNDDCTYFDFWQWLLKHPSIPLCITEGAKKAGALLSSGYAAIALPGVNSGYRTPKDESGNRIGKSRLIPQLEKLVRKREIYIVFDRDSKPNTLKAVSAAIRKMGYLLRQVDCSVKVVTWKPELGKGVDDLIADRGQQTFDEGYAKAMPLEIWKAQTWTQLTHTPQIKLDCRYLPEDLSIPETAKLIGIKSAKGTGKTKLLEKIVALAAANGQWVLVIGHRIQLVQSLCQRFGLKYITEIKDNPHDVGAGFGLCLDSLHPDSSAQFKAIDWSNGVVIIDEIEQVLWHGLNSTTCKDRRVAILKSLKILMQNVLGDEGQVYAADADLSDTTLDYLISLAGINLKPFIIQNDWKPSKDECWQVYNYKESTPKKLVKDLEKHIKDGGKPFVCLSAQKLKSQWGTRTLEAYLKKKFPERKILRIDSESLADPQHPAYGCIGNLDRILINYEIVLASPSIETGVSIEIKNHFTSVWCIAQGIQGENTVRQTLGRIRENIPRHIWCATYGFNRIGNGSTSIPNLLTSGHRLTQLNIRLLQQSDFDAIEDIDTEFQAESLLCWAKMAVRFNAAMINYRDAIVAGLQDEGHQIKEPKVAIASKVEKGTQTTKPSTWETTGGSGKLAEVKSETKSLTCAIAEVREQNYQAECVAIEIAPDLSTQEYFSLNKRVVKTNLERRKLRKFELHQRYQLPVTAKLVALDDDGWYQQLRLHYFLTVGRPFLAQRDAIVARKMLERGDGSLFLPDFNNSQLGTTIGTMETLGISQLLVNPVRELTNLDEDLQVTAAIAIANRLEIKTATGIGIAKNASPITIVRCFIDRLGYALQCIRCGGDRRKRIRVYQIVEPLDDRQLVFEKWLALDRQRPGSSILWQSYLLADAKKVYLKQADDCKYTQLSLDL
ncbi:MAG: plasmid replication protein, CyRepA1 family [Xenococcaceae cyanobacterium]